MKKLVLDDKNFMIIPKVNPACFWSETRDNDWECYSTGDIWMHKDTKQQLFTWDAAVREVAKLKDGRRLPTIDELCSFSDEELKKPFNGLLAGYRNTDGSFFNRGSYTHVWSSSESGSSAWERTLYSGYTPVYRNPNTKAYGFSVRLVREVEEKEPQIIDGVSATYINGYQQATKDLLAFFILNHKKQ